MCSCLTHICPQDSFLLFTHLTFEALQALQRHLVRTNHILNVLGRHDLKWLLYGLSALLSSQYVEAQQDDSLKVWRQFCRILRVHAHYQFENGLILSGISLQRDLTHDVREDLFELTLS